MQIIKVISKDEDEKPEHISNLENIFLNNNVKKEKILCIGEVQSGKTKNIIMCVNKCIEEKWSISIILGGTNNLLTEQTKKRFDKDIKNGKIFIVENFDSALKNIIYYFNNKIHLIFIMLKNDKNLEKILELTKLKIAKIGKILFIDDECDYASNNISTKDESKIYSLINKIYEEIELGKMISITGTPFANILENSKIKNEQNKFTRSLFLKHSEEYTGLEYFNNKNSYLITECNKKDEDLRMPLGESLLTFLYFSAIGLKNDENYKSEFLINIDLNKEKHEWIYKEIHICFANFCRYPQEILLRKIGVILNKYKFVVKYDPKEISDFIIKIFNSFVDSCDKITNKIKNIFLLNSDNENEFQSGKCKFSIIIGGTMISRGFTFKYLNTELILNAPDENIAIDTLLQRARWFGYRKNTELIHVFMNRKIFNAYREANEIMINVKKFSNNLYELENYCKSYKNDVIKLSAK